MNKDELYFRLLTEAFPEQYDVFWDRFIVAYVRVRHGSLMVECPDCGGDLVLEEKIEGWFCIVLCEIDEPVEIPFTKDESIGIDYGTVDFGTTNIGEKIIVPEFFRKDMKKIGDLQKKAAKKKKRSNNRRKIQQKVAKLYRKTKNQRKDFLDKKSREIANRYKGIFIEDLDMQAIIQKYGKDAADQGWYLFTQMLKYKANHCSKVDRYYPSSQLCSGCGHQQPMPLEIRIYDCESCDLELDRDINAAINIHEMGYKNYAGGSPVNACEGAIIPPVRNELELLESVINRKHLDVGQEAN